MVFSEEGGAYASEAGSLQGQEALLEVTGKA